MEAHYSDPFPVRTKEPSSHSWFRSKIKVGLNQTNLKVQNKERAIRTSSHIQNGAVGAVILQERASMSLQACSFPFGLVSSPRPSTGEKTWLLRSSSGFSKDQDMPLVRRVRIAATFSSYHLPSSLFHKWSRTFYLCLFPEPETSILPYRIILSYIFYCA